MKMHMLRRTQVIERDIGDVFSFFARPENLARLTPPWLRMAVLTPSPIEMKAGAVIDYAVKVIGMGRHWRTLITAYDPPYSFVDEQIAGPYRFWHHTHTFSEHAEGTRIDDEVRYILPFGILGEFAHAVFVKRQLKKIFDYRASMIASLWPTVPRPECADIPQTDTPVAVKHPRLSP